MYNLLTDGLDTEQIIQLAEQRPEIPWKWGIRLNKQETEFFAKENGLEIEWNKPIRPGDYYLGRRNTGYHLLTCAWLGEACIHPKEFGYAYDFCECVRVKA